jgi:4-hydroxy-tetrahydrodipicolinate synthase
MQTTKQFGLSCALALPFNPDSSIDYGRLSTHACASLEAGCSTITVFGTTGEGPSISAPEREQILSVLAAAGINLRQRVIGGVAAASVGEAVEQARFLINKDTRGLLLAPPFYFKNVSDEGLYRWFSQVCERLGEQARDVILYHIPSVTNVGLSIELIGRLKMAFPEIVIGVKDSGGDWAYTEKLLRTHGDLILIVGDERHLAAGIRLGAQGAISGLANVCPEILLRLIDSSEDDLRVIELVNEILKFPVTPAVKALLAHRQNDPAWLSVRPPLVALSENQAAHLVQAYQSIVIERPVVRAPFRGADRLPNRAQ